MSGLLRRWIVSSPSQITRCLSTTAPLYAASTSSASWKGKTRNVPIVSKKQAAAKAKKKAAASALKDSGKGGMYENEKMTLEDAIHVLRCVEIIRPVNTYELTVKTAMPKGAPIPRGRVTLPFEPKQAKKDTVLIFADGDDAVEARKAGVDIVGGLEIVEPVASGKLTATIILATPTLIRAITPRLGRILGPRGMMPSERRGTVTNDIKGFMKRLTGSREWKGDKAGTVRLAIGKLSFPPNDLVKNIKTFLQSVKVATNTAGRSATGDGEVDPNKPQNPITKVILSSTQGPGISLSGMVS